MKKLLLLAAVAAFAFAVPAHAFSTSTFFAQEDCKDGEKWNEDTQKCEPSGE